MKPLFCSVIALAGLSGVASAQTGSGDEATLVAVFGNVPSYCQFEGAADVPLGDLTLPGQQQRDASGEVNFTCNRAYRILLRSRNGGLTLGGSAAEADPNRRVNYDFGWKNIFFPQGDFVARFDSISQAGTDVPAAGDPVYAPQFNPIAHRFTVRWEGRSDLYAGEDYRDEVTITFVPVN